jgi:hypothetical protein
MGSAHHRVGFAFLFAALGTGFSFIANVKDVHEFFLIWFLSVGARHVFTLWRLAAVDEGEGGFIGRRAGWFEIHHHTLSRTACLTWMENPK